MKKNPNKVPIVTHDAQGRKVSPSVSKTITGMWQALSDKTWEAAQKKKEAPKTA